MLKFFLFDEKGNEKRKSQPVISRRKIDYESIVVYKCEEELRNSYDTRYSEAISVKTVESLLNSQMISPFIQIRPGLKQKERKYQKKKVQGQGNNQKQQEALDEACQIN